MASSVLYVIFQLDLILYGLGRNSHHLSDNHYFISPFHHLSFKVNLSVSKARGVKYLAMMLQVIWVLEWTRSNLTN